MQAAGAHDDLEGQRVALQGDVVVEVGLVGGEFAGGGEAAFFQVDAERGAGSGVAEAAEAGHAERAGGEGGGGGGADGGVGRGGGGPSVFGFGDAEDLEGLEEGGEGDLEGGGEGVGGGGGGGGGVARSGGVVEGCEERFVEECEAWILVRTAATDYS